MGLRDTVAESRALGAQVYVLAAPLQHGSLPGVLAESPEQLACLMEGEPELQAVSPHLVAVPADRVEFVCAWLEQHGPASPCATVIVSTWSLAALTEHLRAFLRVRLPDGDPIVLAYWDPSILATLLGSVDDDTLFVPGPVLSERQRQAFLAPVLRWWYWDRAGVLRRVDWLSDAMSVDAGALRPPFRLEQAQVDALIEASVPDGLLLHLNERDPAMFGAIAERERYGFVCRQIERARRHGIEGVGAQMEYCALAARFGEGFEASSEGAGKLAALLASGSERGRG
jgi:hypothetical protein